MTRPILKAPIQSEVVVDDNGKQTEVLRKHLELMAYRLKKIEDALFAYTALNTGTATTAQIATALNLIVSTSTET